MLCCGDRKTRCGVENYLATPSVPGRRGVDARRPLVLTPHAAARSRWRAAPCANVLLVHAYEHTHRIASSGGITHKPHSQERCSGRTFVVLAESSTCTDAPLCYTLGDARKGESRTTGRLTWQGERQGATRGRLHAFQAAVHPAHGSSQAAFPSSPGEVESKIAGAVGAGSRHSEG